MNILFFPSPILGFLLSFLFFLFHGTLGSEHISAEERSRLLSFEPPFEEFDFVGNKLVNSNWKNYGSTVVNKNFIRLTPDRQSKKGALWSRSSVASDKLNAVLKFRISGQGKNFFGDGLAMWIVNDSDYIEGDLHGFVEKFYGIGIIFDTFKNTEHMSSHRDVTVLVNDGDKTFELMTEDIMGCNTNIRYYSERADFSVSDSTIAKVSVEGGKLIVDIDPKNTGDWMPCVEVHEIELKEDWLLDAHVGFSGTTGQLADNHDIISFKTFSGIAAMDESVGSTEIAKHFEFDKNASVDERLAKVEEALNSLIDRQAFFDHHFEHEIVGVEDHIKNLQGKLEKVDMIKDSGDFEAHIAGVEEEIRRDVESVSNQAQTNIKKLEKDIQNLFDRKLKEMNREVKKVSDKSVILEGSSNSWFWPFLFLIILQCCAVAGAYFFYNKLKKRHIL